MHFPTLRSRPLWPICARSAPISRHGRISPRRSSVSGPKAPRTEGDIDMIDFTINGRSISVDLDADTPLLWVIRDEIDLTGTKYGCGIGMCGACTVHVGGRATRSCIT